MSQINSSFGSGGMTIALNELQLSSFIQFLRRQQPVGICKAASIVGEQVCGNVWVVGPDIHISSDGALMPQEEHEYVWLETGFNGSLAVDLQSRIQLPLINSPSAMLSKLLMLLRTIMKHNFHSSLLVLAGTLMTLHYRTMQSFEGCPVVVALGEAETGKSTSVLTAMSMLGKFRQVLLLYIVTSCLLK